MAGPQVPLAAQLAALDTAQEQAQIQAARADSLAERLEAAEVMRRCCPHDRDDAAPWCGDGAMTTMLCCADGPQEG